MQRIPELTSTLSELQRLGQMRAALSETLSSHANRLKSTGALPPEDLLHELLTYRTGLFKLSNELATTIPSLPANESLSSPFTLDAAESIVATKLAQQRATDTLHRIAKLAHIDDDSFAPLAECRARAAQLLEGLQNHSSPGLDPVTLNAELLPFEGLLILLQASGELSDSEWATNHEMVTARWGRSLSTALARGKIHSITEIVSESQPLLSVDTISECERQDPEKSLDHVENPDAQDETQSHSIFDTMGESCTERTPSRSYRSSELTSLAAESSRWMRSLSPDVVSPQSTPQGGTTDVLAGRVFAAAPGDRAAELPPLILQLLLEDRPALACYLRRALDTMLPLQRKAPPTWLIHTLALCRQMCYSRGEIARQIEENLQQFTPEQLASTDPDQVAADGFFLRAAALLPALLNASPAATRILKSFRILPGLSHLYNYCGRIVSYGQQLQGQAADLFTPDVDSDLWADELEDLQSSIDNWMKQIVDQHCPATKSSPLFLHAHWTLMASTADRHAHTVQLWSKWQETFRIVHRLLGPVRIADESQRHWVKTELERLAGAVRMESAVRRNEPLPVGTILFPDEQMVVVIRQGIAHANRWLRLCASKPNQGHTLISREADTLRDEILERTDSVLEELWAYSQAHPVPPVRSSIVCLCRMIEHLRVIFSPLSTLALREPEPQEVFLAELLPIPRLELNSAGHPLLDSEQMVDVLLTYLRDTTQAAPQTFSALAAALERRSERATWRRGASAMPRPLITPDLSQDSEPTDTCWE